METCNAVGCFKPRHKSTGGYEYAYCYEHWLQRMEAYKSTDQVLGENTAMKSDTCTVHGCTEPRMRNKKGELLTMCQTHQREQWRKYSSKGKAEKAQTTMANTIGKVVEVPAEPPLDEATLIVKVNPIQHDCNNCEAKLVIEALKAKSPKLAKLIDAMQAEVEASAELGL